LSPAMRDEMDNKEQKEKSPKIPNRLQQALKVSEDKRLGRVEQVKAKTGRIDLPAEQRKLTQQEAAAYCGVSTATIHRWAKDGLKAVSYGQRKRYFLKDLQDYMKKIRFKE
jgi:hypothetical protein